MIIGIDATNFRSGGAVNYLVELLRNGNPLIHDFTAVVVWAPSSIHEKIEDRPWLFKRFLDVIDNGNYIQRAFWQKYQLGQLALSENCDILFVPGGSFATDYRPIVTSSQNILPFEFRELFRYGLSTQTIKFLLLRLIQSISFTKANGVIFLSHYAQNVVQQSCCISIKKKVIIPFGINEMFYSKPRSAKEIGEFSENNPFRLAYNSSIENYKHHCRVVEAVAKLREKTGWPLFLEFYGPASPSALKQLKASMKHFDVHGSWLHYYGILPIGQLVQHMHNADLGVFASSCENLPNALLEMMAAGIPIASSNRGPMPEILKDTAVYFNPEESDEIIIALEMLIGNHELRQHLAEKSYSASLSYSWKDCADQTFNFLSTMLH
jgi:glycosyltransferase involved in cell wall biosynthesis